MPETIDDLLAPLASQSALVFAFPEMLTRRLGELSRQVSPCPPIHHELDRSPNRHNLFIHRKSLSFTTAGVE